jgi:hypothetical protein
MKPCLVLLASLLLVASVAAADGPQTGQVTGLVQATGGQALAGVPVSLTGDRGTVSAVTDAEGRFRFAAILPGSYTVSAEMEGLQATGRPVEVKAGDRSDVVLELSALVSDTVVVTGEAPLVSKFDTSGGGTMQAVELEAITATPARNYRSNLLALPGVYSDSSSTQGNRPSAEGTEGPRQMYIVDGVDVSFSRWGGGSQLQVPSVAIQEMKMQTSGADAEYSRTIGTYTTATIKSGSNKFHGNFEVMGQDLSWNAKNENVPEERPSNTEISWQGAVGGRLITDKLWFFAAAKQDNNPAYAVMASGDAVTEPNVQEARLLKLDARPNDRHSLALSYVVTPWDFPWWNPAAYYDLETVSLFEYPGDLLSARWNFTASNSLLFEASLSTTEPEQNRIKFIENTIDPNCEPNQPCGNAWVYQPLDGDRFFRNGIGLPLGEGFTTFPRDQANLSANWFRGNHDFKLGLDLQETAWELGGVTPPLCRGRGYDPNAPGGYDSNITGVVAWCRFFPTQATWQQGYGPVKFEQSNRAVFLRDRFSTGRWTFNIGARYDKQQHDNDAGTSVLDSSDLMPRVSAVYDLKGDGKLLLKASGGRYVSQMEQSWTVPFNLSPTGRAQYEQYNFNRATGEYDIFTRAVTGGSQLSPVNVQPPYKDEYTLGFDWQFHPVWAFKAQAVTWKRRGAPAVLSQLDSTGRLIQEAGDTPGVKMDHDALHLSIQRRFKDNWMLAASYSLSSTEGNCAYNDNGGCAAAFGEIRAFTNDQGVPWSEVNRYGNLREDRPHMFKLRGAYRFDLGGSGQSINIGGLLSIHSGYPWNSIEETTIPDEIDPFNSNTSVTIFTERRGSHRTPTQSQLDLNVGWRFPIASGTTGGLRLEVINLTDEQELWGISGLPNTGVPNVTSANYQDPRRVRLLAEFRF